MFCCWRHSCNCVSQSLCLKQVFNLRTHCSYTFRWFSKEILIISLHSFHRLVFVMKTHCVLWELRNKYLIIIIIHLPASGVSPGDSGYYACTYIWNKDLSNLSRRATWEACSSNLESWELSQHSRLDRGKIRKICAEVAGRRTFRILTYSQQSGNYHVNMATSITWEDCHAVSDLYFILSCKSHSFPLINRLINLINQLIYFCRF
jgi:hypothetical protein